MEDPKPVSARRSTEWFLYPPTSKTLSCGDLVYFRPKSAGGGRRGTIVQVMQDRALVRFQNTHDAKSISLKRLIPVYTRKISATLVILTRDTHFYRHLAASQVSNQDAVLEIGCSTGMASCILINTAESWMGFDVSKEMVEQCRSAVSTPERVYHMNILMDPAGAETLIQQHFSKKPSFVFMDIGGNRDVSSVLKVLQWTLETCPPQLVVIKSQALIDECTQNCPALTKIGGIHGADEWFHTKLSTLQTHKQSIVFHPLQAPLVLSPVDNATPICRYHNYSTCKKAEDDECPFDHTHCHACRQAGHVARECPQKNE